MIQTLEKKIKEIEHKVPEMCYLSVLFPTRMPPPGALQDKRQQLQDCMTRYNGASKHGSYKVEINNYFIS